MARIGSVSNKAIPVSARILAVLLVLESLCPALAGEPGVIVSRIEHGGAAARAGVEVHDKLISWKFSDEELQNSGEFASPLAVDAVQSIWGYRGKTTLSVRRGDQLVDVQLPVGNWGLQVRANLEEQELKQLGTLDALLANSDYEAAVAATLAWRESLVKLGDTQTAAWLSGYFGTALQKVGQRDAAWPFFREPLGNATNKLPVRDRVSLLERYASHLKSRQDRGQKRLALEEAVELQRNLADRVRLAKLVSDLAYAQARSGDFAAANVTADESLILAEAEVPGSLTQARALTTKTGLLGMQGRDAEAIEMIDRAISLLYSVDAPANNIAGALSNRGLLSRHRGELAQAETYFRQSLQQADDTDEGSRVRALALNNFALVLKDRGDLRAARRSLAEALAINQQLNPNSTSYVRNLGNLAGIDEELGNVGAAAQGREAITAYWRSTAPDGPELGVSLAHNAAIAEQRNQFDAADKLHRQSLAQLARVAPTSPNYVKGIVDYAEFLRRQNQFDQAAEIAESVVALAEEIAADALLHASALRVAGQLAIDRGEVGSAAVTIAAALQILLRDAPDSFELAETYFVQFRFYQQVDDLDRARQALESAVAVLERQRAWLPRDDESQRHFSDRYRRIYTRYTQQLIDDGDIGAALETIERFRARSLVALLARRDIQLLGPTVLARDPRQLTSQTPGTTGGTGHRENSGTSTASGNSGSKC